jgi:pantothenate kinase type III
VTHIHSRKEGHSESVSNQLSQALHSKFIDQEDNEEKQVDRVILVTSRNVNDAARKVFRYNFPNRTLIIIDGKRLAENIVKYSLVERILQTNVQRRHFKVKNKN